MGDQLGAFEQVLERSEVVAGRAEVDSPHLAVMAAESEQPDVAPPRVERVALPVAVGLDVEGDRAGVGQVGGDRREFGAGGRKDGQ